MEKITGVLVNAEKGTIEKATITKSLESYYQALNCSMIDIVPRVIGGVRVDVICDDEGLFSEEPILTAVDAEGYVMFVGSLFIVKFDGVDDVTSLSSAEINKVLSVAVPVASNRKILFPCYY